MTGHYAAGPHIGAGWGPRQRRSARPIKLADNVNTDTAPAAVEVKQKYGRRSRVDR